MSDRRSTCRGCGGEAGPIVIATENMIGRATEFSYLECAACGSLSLLDPPNDLAPFYDDDYYSFDAPSPPTPAALSRLTSAKRAVRRTALSLAPQLALRLDPKPPRWLRMIATARASARSRILDVGSGSGRLLRELAAQGFSDLTGVDPFLPEHTVPAAGSVRLIRGTIDDLDEAFDLVMLNHSFEHMDDPAATLRAARRVTAVDGTIVVRCPFAGQAAWREYGAYWVQLDAPRHLYLPTPTALADLARSVGLRVVDTYFDSTGLQFWGSELYRRGLPLATDPATVFSSAELAAWEARAAALNDAGDGDQGAFFLR